MHYQEPNGPRTPKGRPGIACPMTGATAVAVTNGGRIYRKCAEREMYHAGRRCPPNRLSQEFRAASLGAVMVTV